MSQQNICEKNTFGWCDTYLTFQEKPQAENSEIPLGGSDILGFYSYLDVYRELLEQGIADHVTDIVVATSTGGTLAGLCITNYLGNKDKIR